MSAHPHSSSLVNREVLGELLHSVSQPLTTLRCSLELSLDEESEQQQQAVTAALEQTENVIGMIQLMREYLDSEQGKDKESAIELTPVLQEVCEELRPLAMDRDIRLRMIGTCSAKMAISHDRIRKALHYLISTMIELQSPGTKISVHLAGCTAGAVVWIQGEVESPELKGLVPHGARQRPAPNSFSDQRSQSTLRQDSVKAAMRRARLAIAARLLENAGAALTIDQPAAEFVLRIPRLSGKGS